MTGLKVEGLKVVYHRSILALDGIDLEVPKGSVVALLGANGAGKSTTLRAISGFMGADSARITAGSIRYGGTELRHLRLPATTRHGIVLVPERDKVFPNLTVEENLSVVVSSASRADRRRIEEAVFTYFPRIASVRKRAAGLLSGGERQMLAVGAALLCAPTLMLIDELSLGLAPVVVDELLARLRQIQAASGMTILLVEQSAAVALSIASHGYVLESGRVALSDSAEALRGNPRVQELYLGSGDRNTYRDTCLEGGPRRRREGEHARP
ncbi:MAG: ABC transporter ATP-binding protein [Bradyrhizobium sp.]|nr:ABC transporter ATP-binding protein [Bradyrhizobium sp.]